MSSWTYVLLNYKMENKDITEEPIFKTLNEVKIENLSTHEMNKQWNKKLKFSESRSLI